MAQLTFTGRSGDGKRLLLKDSSGQEHTLAIDARLRRALAGSSESHGSPHHGQLEIPMESTLRPRDIQARIRAGETPEAVAHAANTSVEKIMPFAAPVMAERAHMVQRAQIASVRRRASESGARTLGEAVDAHLRSHNVDPGIVEWDAWRREDGRWTLTGLFDVAGRTGAATFSHDPRGNFVTVDDEDARWLIGDASPAGADPVDEPASDDLAAARRRRLGSGADSDEALALGEDAIEMVADEESATETTMEISAPERSSLGADQPVEAPLDDTAASRDRSPDAPVQGDDSTGETEVAAERRPRPAKKRGRPSVPSWDEIMFGGGKND